MLKRVVLGVGVLAALAAMPTVGSAQSNTVCTTAGFQVCVNFNLVSDGTSGGVANYHLAVTYVSSQSSTSGALTTFGFYWLLATPTYAMTPDSVLAPGGSHWSVATSCTNLSGGGTTVTQDACASADPPPVGNGLTVGQTAALYFHTPSSVTLANLDAAMTYNSSTATLADRAFIQGYGPLNCSIKVDALQPNNVVGGGAAYVRDCGSPTTVPEPSVIMLLGSGMMGLGFAGVRRRFLS